MDKYEVVAEARAYMRKILCATDRINERQRCIDDNETMLRLDPAAAIVNYNKAGGNHTGEAGSIVENLQLRHEELREKIKTLKKEIDEIQAEHDKVMTFLQTFVLDLRFGFRSKEADVVRHLYINRTSKTDTAHIMRCSRQTIDALERNALLSLASCLLNIRADGEYYNSQGFYEKRDKRTLEIIKNMEECKGKSVEELLGEISNCG